MSFIDEGNYQPIINDNAKVRRELNQKLTQLEKLQKETLRLDNEISKKT